MEKAEEILAVIKGVDNSLSGVGRVEFFDLCITNKRLVIIKPKTGKWTRMGGRFMKSILKRREVEKRQKQDPLKNLTIDELLEKDKSSYAINYSDLDWIRLNKSLFGSNLTFKGKKIWKIFKIIKEQYSQLSQILPKIDALKEKIEIKE